MLHKYLAKLSVPNVFLIQDAVNQATGNIRDCDYTFQFLIHCIATSSDKFGSCTMFINVRYQLDHVSSEHLRKNNRTATSAVAFVYKFSLYDL